LLGIEGCEHRVRSLRRGRFAAFVARFAAFVARFAAFVLHRRLLVRAPSCRMVPTFAAG
jgi:hypothetical protein